MKVGLFYFPASYTASPATVARKAEALGFESLWVPEHPAIPAQYQSKYPLREDGKAPEFYGHIADPFVTLSAAAAVTTKIKLATGVCLVPEHHPLVLAKTVATLDQQSDGRVILGVGAGWLREEAEATGVDFPRRWRRLRESVQAMRELWTKGEAEFHGQSVDFPVVRSYPQPVQKPVPVLLGAHDEKGMRRVAQWADGWCPIAAPVPEFKKQLQQLRQLTDAADRDFKKFDLSAFLGVNDKTPVADLLRQYEDVGVQRIVLTVGTEDGPFAFRSLRFFSPGDVDKVLDGVAKQAGLT